MIPDSVIREIQDRLDLVEVVGAVVELRKAGQNFKGLCPFHPEKTPSFMVYRAKQFFICYGCGAGGDMITFVMKHERLEFAEAVEFLAQKAGVELARVSGKGRRAEPDLYRAHTEAAAFYHRLLLEAPEAEAARNYLTRRGLGRQTWETFSLGFAPDRFDGFLKHAGERGLKPELLERAGIAVARERGRGWFDRFRNRVIFPIWDARGRVIAFGGRILDEEGPKYLNSPETALYVKGKVLYGLHLAAPAIREQDFCIVVEGYMDLATPFQHGIRNIVASMGTSLTEAQVRLIRRHTRHVVMVYDADFAGQAATLRGLDLFVEAEMRVKVAPLPPGTDPDTLVREKGVEAFARAIQASQELFDYKLGLLTRQFDPNSLEGRVGICQEMLPTLKRMPNALHRGEYIRRLAEALRVDEALLWRELGRVRLGRSEWTPAELGMPQAPASTLTAEDLLAGLLLEEPQWVAQVEGRLEPALLESEPVRRVVSWLIEQHREGALPADHRELLSRLPRGGGEVEGKVARWLAGADSVADKEQVLDEVIERLRRRRERATLEALQAMIREAETQGDGARAEQLILEYNRRIKEGALSARTT